MLLNAVLSLLQTVVHSEVVFSDQTLFLAAGCESTLYRCQFKEADSYWWENFGPSDDVTLEKLYCDVNNLEVLLELTDTALR